MGGGSLLFAGLLNKLNPNVLATPYRADFLEFCANLLAEKPYHRTEKHGPNG